MIFPEPRYRNSAGRLLTILNQFKANRSTLENAIKSFGCEKEGQSERVLFCFEIFVEINRLFEAVECDIQALGQSPATKSIFLETISKAKTTITPLNLESAGIAISDSLATSLQVLATMIPVENAIEENDLDIIRSAIESLRQTVDDATISPTLRAALQELIRLADDAVNRFNCHGAKGLKKAFKSMLGEAMELHQDGTPKENPTAWATIMSLLKQIDAVIGRVVKYRLFFNGTNHLFLGSESSSLPE